MNGALPPNSIEVFLTVAAHCSISNLPTSVEPVKVSSPPITATRQNSKVSGIRSSQRPPQPRDLAGRRIQTAKHLNVRPPDYVHGRVCGCNSLSL